jgi:hypothetical protein
VERLRDERFGRYLIKRWEEAVEDLDLRGQVPPELRNTDGEPLLLTTDHFEIEPGARAEVEARLAALEGVEPPDAGEDSREYVFLRSGNPIHASWETTVIGRAWVSADVLHLEANSRERADALRGRVEEACGNLIRHRAREHADPLSQGVWTEAAARPQAPPPPEEEQLILDFKRRHYDEWLEHDLPALGGKSPREAARTAQGRGAVDVLLKDMENWEQRSSGDAAFDFSLLRKELGLE